MMGNADSEIVDDAGDSDVCRADEAAGRASVELLKLDERTSPNRRASRTSFPAEITLATYGERVP
jgi:hypothetical protein